MRATVFVVMAAIATPLVACDQVAKNFGYQRIPSSPAAHEPQSARDFLEQDADGKVQVGRYVVIHSPQVERDTILLDTATGRTWYQTAVTDAKGQPLAWEPEPQLNTSQDQQALYAKFGFVGPAAPGSRPPLDAIMDGTAYPPPPAGYKVDKPH